MKTLAILIGSCINWVIFIFAIVTLGGLIFVAKETMDLKKKIDDDQKKNRTTKLRKDGIETTPDAYTWESVLAYEDEFNQTKIRYSLFGQFIPIFPLLGILGTVAGMIQQLDAGIDEMKMAVTVSMSTTFWGLIAAIVLKFVDALFTSKEILKMDNFFDTFDQKYQMAKDKYDQDAKD